MDKILITFRKASLLINETSEYVNTLADFKAKQFKLVFLFLIPYNTAGIFSRLGAGRPRNLALIAGCGKRFFFLQKPIPRPGPIEPSTV